MTDREITIPPSDSERTVLGCRVSQDVQDRFGKFVTENLSNRRGAYGYAVEKAMIEFMDTDRYARLEDELSEVRSTVEHTNALVRQIVTAEKEKGAFLEPAPRGNRAGDRKERENVVVRELVNQIQSGELSRVVSESTLNEVIVEVAGVSSEPSKRDYRESLMERGFLEPRYSKSRVTDSAFELLEVKLDE